MNRFSAVAIKPFRQKFCIVDSSGDYFYNKQGEMRKYSKPGSAVAFLRRTGYEWVVDMPSGRKLFVNCIAPEIAATLGPHDWIKENTYTIIDEDGVYDVWRCVFCRTEEKRFGLSGRPPAETCEKNPLANSA